MAALGSNYFAAGLSLCLFILGQSPLCFGSADSLGLSHTSAVASDSQPAPWRPQCGENPDWASQDESSSKRSVLAEQGSSKSFKTEKRIAVVLRGEAFRNGGQHSRIIASGDTDIEAQREQSKATQSQIDLLVKPFELANIPVDVFSASYYTAGLDDLLSRWGDRLKVNTQAARRFGWLHDTSTQATNIEQALLGLAGYMKENRVSYSDVVVLRHDMELKQDLKKLIMEQEDGDDFLAPFHITKKFRWYENRVPDTLQVMPGNQLGCFMDIIIPQSAPSSATRPAGNILMRMMDMIIPQSAPSSATRPAGNILMRMMDMIIPQSSPSSATWPAENIFDRMKPALDKIEGHMGFLMDGEYADSNPAVFSNPLYLFPERKEGPRAPQQ